MILLLKEREVLHRHELAQVGAAEGPGVEHLAAVGVDDLQDLPFGKRDGRAVAGGDHLRF